MATAIRLRQLAIEHGRDDLRVCVLEKAPEMGAHTLSGAVIDVGPLTKLIPDWKERGVSENEEAKFYNFWHQLSAK